MSDWDIFFVTTEQAQAYAAWAQEKDGGGTVASWREQYPTEYARWKPAADANAQAAGAADSDDLEFRLWLVANHENIAASRVDLTSAIGRNKSAADESALIEAKFPN